MDIKIRFDNTIKEIEYSNCYDNNIELFNKGVEILKNRINKNDFSEFKDSERDIIENIFCIMEMEK